MPVSEAGQKGGVKVEAWQKNYSQKKMIDSIIRSMFEHNSCPGGEQLSNCDGRRCEDCWREVLEKVVKEG
jgi:hypothetical protein